MIDLIPSPTLDLSALDRADLADGTRRHYKAEITLLDESGVNPFNYEELVHYANTRPHSGKRNLQAALKHVMKDYVNRAKTSNAPVETIQRFIWAVEVMDDAISAKQPAAQRVPHWLSPEQVTQITEAAYQTSMRDYIVMSLLLGAGLRCKELSELTFDKISQIPYEGGMKDIIPLTHGKGGKNRDIPIPSALARHIREWHKVAGDGKIARRFYKGGKLGKGLSTFRIFKLVRKYGLVIGVDDLDPHDCRRSYGRIMYYANGKNIMLVMELLGHNDVKVTQGYIGLKSVLTADVFPAVSVNVAGD